MGATKEDKDKENGEVVATGDAGHAERMLWLWSNMIGHVVQVSTRDGMVCFASRTRCRVIPLPVHSHDPTDLGGRFPKQGA